MSKKISEWLKELPMPYREMALYNYANGKIRDVLVNSMSSALSFAFDWRQSPEGHEYWNDVFDRLATGDLSTGTNDGCDIKKQLDEVTKQRDVLAETLKVAMARAYARGYQHGHDDSVESSFINVKEQDAPEYFAEDVTQMLLDGGQPEAAAALAAVKGGEG